MLPTTFKESNLVLGKPADMTDEECYGLPAFKGRDTAGWPVIISKWQLSKEDLEEVNKTGCIWLAVTGESTPPVALSTESPFNKPE
jgi:hypothetical protein